jgi:hypothetical protein
VVRPVFRAAKQRIRQPKELSFTRNLSVQKSPAALQYLEAMLCALVQQTKDPTHLDAVVAVVEELAAAEGVEDRVIGVVDQVVGDNAATKRTKVNTGMRARASGGWPSARQHDGIAAHRPSKRSARDDQTQ